MSEHPQVVSSSLQRLAELRQLFKTACQATDNQFQNYQIRVHRALSWLERAFEMDALENPDGRLLFDWIAFNSLYGGWDPVNGTALRERDSYAAYLGQVMLDDAHGVIPAALQMHRDLILKIFDNKFLDPLFWRNPQPGVNPATRRRYYEAQSLIASRRWTELLVSVVDRIYVLRCQVAHGAATRGSSLNRETLQTCGLLLEQLLLPMVNVTIANGAHDRWPALCYPPIREATEIKPAPRGARPK